ELTRPYLGYITRPMRVVQIENFTAEQMLAAADLRSNFDVAMVFSTKYEPRHSLLERWRTWQQWKTRFFGYYRDIPPAAAAQILGGRLVYIEARNGQWVGIIEMEQTIEANAHTENPAINWNLARQINTFEEDHCSRSVMISDARIECRHANSCWRASPHSLADTHRERAGPGGPGPLGLDGNEK